MKILCETFMLLYLLLYFSATTLSLDESDVFQKVPWIISEFQQVVIFSETTSLQFVEHEIDVSWMKTSVPKITGSESFNENFDSPYTLTAILISERNSTLLLEMLHQILVFPKDQFANDLEEFMLSSFTIIVWPTVLTSNSSRAEFVSQIKIQNLSIPLHSNVFILTENSDKLISLWEVYSIKGIQILELVRQDATTPFILWDVIKFKWKRRNNFHGATIIATATKDPIYASEVNFTINSNGTTALSSGMAVYVFRTFRDYLNFTEAAIVGEYIGQKSDDPNILGMDIYLQQGVADISITQSGVTEEKSQVVTLLHSTTASWLEARFSHEPGSKWKFFISPFRVKVWALVIAHIVLMLICATLYQKTFNAHEIHDELVESSSWDFVQIHFLWVLGTLCQQGWYEWPSKTPSRVLFIVASVTGFLLNAAYSGTITSQLSIKDPVSLTFEKLLNLSYLFFMENDFSFPVDPDTYPKRITIDTLHDLNDSSVAVNNLFKMKSAMISYPEFFYSVIQYGEYTDAEGCELFTTIRVSKTPNLCSMSVKKRSPLKEVFNLKILYMWERGVLPRLNADYKKKTQLRCEFNNHILDPQTTGELFLAYFVIISGTSAALVFLFSEILLERIHPSSLLRLRPYHIRSCQSISY